MVPPFTFSLVCRSWRTLVLSHPTLWSEISVRSRDEPGTYDLDPRDPVIYRIIKRWLTLSSHAPLWIQIDLSYELEAVHETILSLFVKEYPRWSFACINVDYWMDPASPKPSTFTLEGFAPVTSLSLRIFGSYHPTVVVDLSSFINDGFSHLEYLSVTEGATACVPMDRSALRLPRLRSLLYEIKEGENVDGLRCILSASPILGSLHISVSTNLISILAPNRGLLHLPCLTSLSLTSCSRLVTNFTFNTLTCPSLRELRFRTEYFYEVGRHSISDLRDMHDFLVRSYRCSTPPLLLLKFDWMSSFEPPLSSHTAELRDLLAYLRNLKTLQLHGFVLDRAVIKLLTVPSGGQLESPLCPLLSRISMSYASWMFSNFTSETLEEMIVSRWKAGVIREVTFKSDFLEFENFGERNRVQECIREGLVFEDMELK